MTGTNYTYDRVTDSLRAGIVRLSFIKVKDGEVRNIRATLSEKYIPDAQKPTTDVKKNEETVRVYDLDVEGWRSFRINSLQTFEPIV